MPMPYKGVRVPVTLRLPADIHREAVARARRSKLSLNEYLVRIISDATEVEDTAIGARAFVTVYDDEGRKIGVA